MHKLVVMWIAVELIIMPVLLITAIIVIGIFESFSPGGIVLALVVFVTLYASIRALFRFIMRVEHDEGVEGWEREEELEQHESAARPASANQMDLVDECGDESFPASDPPSWTLGTSKQASSHSTSNKLN